MLHHGVFGCAAAQSQDTGARLQAESASRTAGEARTRIDDLQVDVEKILMITEALWNILKEKHGYEDDDLLRMVQDIDLRDGQLDGKVAKQPNPPCTNCGRTLMGRHPVCLYCGSVAIRAPFER